MKKTISFSISMLFATMLSACGSSKDASNGNFEKAINAHFAKECITIDPIIIGAENQSYPMTVVMQQKSAFNSQAQVDQNNAIQTRPVDLLVKVGVLSVVDGTKKEKTLFSASEITVPTKVYTLTEIGKKALVRPDHTAICLGHYKVDEITRFTQPSSVMGQTMSEVSLTISPIDVPEWAKDAELQKLYALDQKLAAHQRSTSAVILASDGWIEANDFGR